MFNVIHIVEIHCFTMVKRRLIPRDKNMLVIRSLKVSRVLLLNFLFNGDRQEHFRRWRQFRTWLFLAFAELSSEGLPSQEINQLYHAHHGATEAETEDAAEGRWNNSYHFIGLDSGVELKIEYERILFYRPINIQLTEQWIPIENALLAVLDVRYIAKKYVRERHIVYIEAVPAKECEDNISSRVS